MLPVGKRSKSKESRTEAQIAPRGGPLSETRSNRCQYQEPKDSLLFERGYLNVPFNGKSLLVCFK